MMLLFIFYNQLQTFISQALPTSDSMGNFLSQIQGKTVAVDSALLNSTHSKLVEYYSSYKSICEGFTINIPEYTQIFGANQLSFTVWDSKGKGKIDAIEMFSGLLVFSKIRYEQKIKFLFEIFDFNEMGYLYYENLAFMLLNISNATYKIFSIPKTIPLSAIELFLDEYFTLDSRIEMPRLIRWTTKNRFVVDYFREIGYEIDQPNEERRIDTYTFAQSEPRRKKNPRIYSYNKEFRFDPKFINCLDALIDKKQVGESEMMNLQFRWLYGIDVGRQNIKFVKVEKRKAGNQRFIYSVGKIVVIYYPKLNVQQYYKGHSQAISVIEVSKFNKLAASAECGEYPSIQIWDIENRVNLIKFKGVHKCPIKFLKFFKQDKFLITTSESIRFGGQIESPIIILRLDTKQIIMSTYLKLEIIGISISSSTLIVGKSSLTLLAENSRSFNVHKFDLENQAAFKQIIAFVYHPKGFLITAHKNRQFCKWDEKYNCFPIKYESMSQREVIQMVLIGDEMLLVLDELDIEIVNLKIQEPLPFKRKRMLNLGEAKLFNLRLLCMQVIELSKILVVSEFGDVIKVSDIESGQIRLQKYYQLFKMEEVTGVFLPNAHNILFVSSYFLYVVDRYEKELRVLKKYDFQIKLSDECKEHLVAISSSDNKSSNLAIISLVSYNLKQTFKLNYLIDDIKITQNYVLALSENVLTIFHKIQDRYFEKDPVSHKLAIGKMLSLAKQNDLRCFLIINELKEIYKLVINGVNQIDVQKVDKQQDNNFYQKLSIYYPEQNYKHPLVVCSNKRLVAFGRKNGDIQVWESLGQALNQFSSYTLLRFHTDRISRLLLLDNELFSVGGLDGMVAQLDHHHYLEIKEDNSLFDEEEEGAVIKRPKTKTMWKDSETKKLVTFKQLQGSGLREGQVQIVGLIQPENIETKQLIQQILNPSDKVNYQSQTKQSINTDKLVIETECVYGFDSSIFSRNIHYVHSYPSDSTSNRNLDEKFWRDSSSQINKEELQFSKNVLLPIDEDHSNCRRQILYSCDRYCVLRQKNTAQQLYEFHRRKVSATAVHPNKQIICSCEVSNSFAEIHFWKHQQRTVYICLPSKHKSIITKAQFSRDGEWIVTLGGSQRAQSIQIFNWEHEQTIAFRFIEDESIREVLFNPYDKKQLCLAGMGLIRIYRVEQELIIKEECRVEEQTFQAIAYTSNVYGSQIQSDVITGSLEGDIGLYVCGSFLFSHKKAHERGITCLRLVQLFQYKKVLVSGGGDGYVRIWDIKFNEISKKNIRDELYSIKNSSLEMPETIIVNIDIYQCQKKQGNQNSASALMLIATSDGSILEATITNEFQGYKAVTLMTSQAQSLKEKINFDISLALAAPPNNHPFRFQVIQNFLITYSSHNIFLYFWNLNFHTREKIFPLPNPPLFLSKMNRKSVFLIGLQESAGISLKMYVIEWSAGIYIRSITPCGEIELQKGIFTPEAAQFSKFDNKLAVKMKSEETEQIWLYERDSGQNYYQYIIRMRIEEKNPLFISRILWIDFSSKEDAVMVAWRQIKQDSHVDVQIKYKCYDSNNGNALALGCFEFSRFDFSAKVKASYLPCFQLTGQNQKDYSAKDTITVTVMTQYEGYLLMGTSSGEILIVQSEVFAKKDLDPKYFARCHLVSDSPINKLEIRENNLIASCQSSEAVFVMKLRIEKGMKKQTFKDSYNELINAEELQRKLKQTYQKRKKIESQMQCLSINCGIDLRIAAVIGRNAFYKRNNIFIDLKDNIISFSGCNLLIMKHEQGQRLNQRIIKPDISTTSSHPEISCMVLGDCKRFLLIGTSQENAKIIAWDISTNTNLFDIKLNGFIIINLLKLSYSNKHSIVLATAKNGHQYLLFIDLINKSVLAVHHFHKTVQINDLCFALGQEFRVLVCGVKYMAQWNYCNGLLTQKIYNFNSGQENEEIKAEAIIFYSLIFIEEYAISSGSDGYLYVWKDEKLVKRQNAHPKESILSLYTSLNSKIFVSGANNGTVIIWHFSSSLIIQKLDEYTIYTGKEPKVPTKYQVQSICMTKQSLIVGNRAGEIMHFPFSVDPEKFEEEPCVVSNKIPLPILSGFNHEIIKSCAFNISSRKLYVMTEAESGFGTFSVFDISTLEKIKEQKIELKSPLIRMLAFKLNPKIFFVLKGSIVTYSYQAEVKDDKYNKLYKLKQWLKCELEIKAAAINNSQTFLAVLVAPGPLQNAKIQIYNLCQQEAQFYLLYKIEQNIQASTDIIDFCTDHEYLVYQGTDEEQTIIDLMTKEKIKAGTLENPPEWNEQAKRTTPSIKEITTFYSQENKLLKVVQVMNRGVIATDEMGSVRVFVYPITANKQQNYQVYIQHLNQVYLCVLSPDNRTLVTVSREDRAIHLWDVIHK